MLTTQDLNAIKKLLQPINDKLLEHDKKFNSIDSQLTKINKQLKKNNRDHKTIIEFFENNDRFAEKRLDRIENHLHLPPLAF